MQRILPFLLLFFFQQLTAQNFTPGNLAVLQAASATANNTTASVLEIGSTAAQASPVRAIAIDGNTIRVSGSATSTLYASNSNDGSLFSFTGHYASSTSVNANTLLPRAVVTVDNSGTVSTATTYTGASGNQTRSATSLNNTAWYIADQGGIYTNGGTAPSPTGNVRGIKAFDGIVYVGQQSSTAGSIQVSTVSAPTGGAITGLPGLTNNASFQDFYLVSSGTNGAAYDVLYILSATSATAGTIAKYSFVGGTWVANGTPYTTAFGGFGLAAKAAVSGAYLYATTGNGASAANSVIRLTDAAGYNSAINISTGNNLTLYTTPAGTTLKGLAFTPTPSASVNNLSLSFSTVSASSALNPPAVTSTLADATDPLSTAGVSVDVKDNGANILASDYSLTATSSNTAVLPNAAVIITKADGQATVKITAASVGYADVTLTLTKGSFTKTLVINVAVSAASNTPASTRFHTGSSDASAAIAIDENYMIVGDDEMNKLFVYNRKSSGLPVTSFDFSGLLGLTDYNGGVLREVDVEAATRSTSVANRIYWLGSMSTGGNSFAIRPNRNRLFAVTTTGTGSSTSFSYVGLYNNLRQDLLTWGDAQGYNFTASAAAGKDSKLIDGFNVEGLAFAPDNTTAWVAFRAPLVPIANRTKAVIAPIQNFEAWFNNGSPSGSPTIGAPIELDLGGRGFRDVVRLANGRYIILAGNYDDAPSNPAIYLWNGSAGSAPVLLSAFNVTGLNPEGVMEVYSGGTLQADRLQVLSDNGDNVYYGDGIAAKDLSQNNFKKFRSDVLVSGAGAPLPVVLKSFTVQKEANGALLQWECGQVALSQNFIIERSTNGTGFAAVAKVSGIAGLAVYTYHDAFTTEGKVYYRIALVDADGRRTFSSIRFISRGAETEMVLYPNPVAAGTTTLSVAATGLKYLALFDGGGRKVKDFSFTATSVDINLRDLPKGSYYLVVSTPEKIIGTKPVLVQ